jgi:hypothetical protein
MILAPKPGGLTRAAIVSKLIEESELEIRFRPPTSLELS